MPKSEGWEVRAERSSELRVASIQPRDREALQPGFLSLATDQIDYMTSYRYRLRTIANLRNEVNDRMIDFSMASEHFAYQYTRKFYAIAKQA